MATNIESIPNLVAGISQQAPSLRLPTQAAAQINGFSSVATGLRKRPPAILEPISPMEPVDNTAFVALVDRDSRQNVVVVDRDGHVQVRDLEGGSFEATEPYLISDNPARDIRALTVGDTTFLLNRTVNVAFDETRTPALTNESIVSIRTAFSSARYRILLDEGTAEFTSDSSATASEIARGLATALSGVQETVTVQEQQRSGRGTRTVTRQQTQTATVDDNVFDRPGTGPYTAYRVSVTGPTVWIRRNDGAAFPVTVEDDRGGEAILSATHAVDEFTELPPRAPEGYLMEVASGEGLDAGSYWVKFIRTNVNDDASEGTWEETPGPGEPTAFDAETLPLRLVANGDASTLAPAEWDHRLAGDEDSIPAPSMVGQVIRDLFYFRGRFGFVTPGNVLMSRSGDLLNFWRQTATDLLDDDPIDVELVSHSGASLQSAIAFDRTLFVLSTREQFVVDGEPSLTPNTIEASVASRFDATADAARPVAAGRYAYFAFPRAQFSGFRELYATGDAGGVYDANDVTAAVPRFVTGVPRQIAATTVEDMIVTRTEEDPNRLYVYKFFFDGPQKRQSSWSVWDFKRQVQVAGWSGSDLYVLLDGRHVARLGFSEELRREVHLDLRTTPDTAEYLPDEDVTVFTLPYAPSPTTQVVTVSGDTLGRILEVMERSPVEETVTVKGFHLGANVQVGEPYEFVYEFSTPYLRQQTSTGGTSVRTSGRLQIRRWRVVYANTGAFKARVTLPNREPRTYAFEGTQLGSVSALLGEATVAEGEFSFPVLGRNEDVRVELLNDTHLPCAFTSAAWEADFFQRART